MLTRSITAWKGAPCNLRAVILVSVGAFLLTIMAIFVKHLGETMHSAQLLFFRALIGLLVFAPWLLARESVSILKTGRSLMHLQRGFWGACGNFCFFYAITHLALADAMALQFSRPLFMMVLAFLFLSEGITAQRIGATILGFLGIIIMLKPFGGEYDANGLVGVAGAVFGGLVVITIKKLATTEPTRRIIFYYALYTSIFSAIPALNFWVMPTFSESLVIILIGLLGIIGQTFITHGFTLGEATITVPFDYMRIVYSAIFGVILFSEIPSYWSALGASLIILSNLYLLRRK